MGQLKAGFSRVVITPEKGIELKGYYIQRLADGTLDDLEVNTLALEQDGKRAVIFCIDLCVINQKDMDYYRKAVSKVVGIPMEAIYMTTTHTHTGPYVESDHKGSIETAYFEKLKYYLIAAAQEALDSVVPVRMGWGIGHAPGIAFSRRYRMKDGSVRTNPGVGNPEIAGPIGEVDDRVTVLRFEKENGDNIVLAHFANHPDSVGGCKFSADWPGVMRRTIEKAIPGTKCLFVNGAQGDMGHVKVDAKDGDHNHMTIDFDHIPRGYGHTHHMGYVVAGAVLQVYEKVNFVETKSLNYMDKEIFLPANVPDPSQMEQAHRYYDLHMAGRDDEIPFEGMMLTTVVGEAERMVRLEHGPETFSIKLSGLAIGDIALIGIAGEPFAGVGIELKKSDDWTLVIPTCCTNGAEGYFPMREAYEEGGYESKISDFKPGVAEQIIAEGRMLLKELREF